MNRDFLGQGGACPLPYEKTSCCRGDPCGLPVTDHVFEFFKSGSDLAPSGGALGSRSYFRTHPRWEHP